MDRNMHVVLIEVSRERFASSIATSRFHNVYDRAYQALAVIGITGL